MKDPTHPGPIDVRTAEIQRLMAALAAEQARAERLADALRPFAELAPLFDRADVAPANGKLLAWHIDGASYALSVEHLRAARAALALRPSGDGVG